MPVNITNISHPDITMLDPYNVIVNISNQIGLICYIIYTKGDETSLDITHSVSESDDPNSTTFYNVMSRDSNGILSKFSSPLTSSNDILYPVAVTLPNNKTKINFNFVNSSSPSSEGIVNILIKMDVVSYI